MVRKSGGGKMADDALGASIAKLSARLGVGKRLPDAVYFHVEALNLLPEPARSAIDQVREQAGLDASAFNVVKISTLASRLSFLLYDRFFEDPFPALVRASTVDLGTHLVTTRNYSTGGNALILHRKETLLPPRHPRVVEFAALTAQLEDARLLDDAAAIGRRRVWMERLRSHGFEVRGHTLVRSANAKSGPASQVVVERHRTAIQRNVLSTPLQMLWRHGFLDGQLSLFDYGCGRGGDLQALHQAGITAAGWDPYFAPDQPKVESDIVNLGFVLNVIEDPAERLEALRGAYALTRRILVVSVMIGGPATTERFRRFGDGVLTQRSTFQKYYTQEEIRTYLEGSLGRQPVACAPGVFFVFRLDEDEQAFLAARYRSASAAPPPVVPRSPQPERVRPPRTTRIRLRPDDALLDSFWDTCLALGRVPEPSEFTRWDELRRFAKPEKLLEQLIAERGPEPVERARRRREGDLLVYLAMNHFEKRRSRGSYPSSVRADLKAFFKRITDGEAAATALLFSIAREELLRAAAHEAAAAGVGYLDHEHSLQLHSSLVPRLPPILRVYAACAARLYGDLESADLVKLHLRSGKVTLMSFDDFKGKAIPMMLERVKVNLRTQEIEFFRYTGAFVPQPLYLKSRFLGQGHQHFEEQARFDHALVATGLFDFSGFGPEWSEFCEALRAKRLRIDGFNLVAEAR